MVSYRGNNKFFFWNENNLIVCHIHSLHEIIKQNNAFLQGEVKTPLDMWMNDTMTCKKCI